MAGNVPFIKITYDGTQFGAIIVVPSRSLFLAIINKFKALDREVLGFFKFSFNAKR